MEQDKMAIISLILVTLLGIFISIKSSFSITEGIIFVGILSSLYAFTMSYIEKIT